MHAICRGAIVLCALAFVPAASAQQATPKAAAGEAAPAAWSASEIGEARARCAQLLGGLDVVAVPHDPIREGACGAPAPMRLVSIGSSPRIAFTPPPVLTCDMIAALHRWLTGDVQALARKHLAAPLVGIDTMSSYSCRRAYGRAGGRLSEHGHVNAIDIAGFRTSGGQAAAVLADWGPVAREIVAEAAAAKAEARETQAAAKSGKANKTPRALSAIQTLRSGVAIEFPTVVIREPPSGTAAGLGLAPPSFVGGPKPAAGDRKSLFLRGVHRAACRIFATVLGPEVNKAHANHFHLDMARRQSASICE